MTHLTFDNLPLLPADGTFQGDHVDAVLSTLDDANFYGHTIDETLPADPAGITSYLVNNTLVTCSGRLPNVTIQAFDPATATFLPAYHHWIDIRSPETLRLSDEQAVALRRSQEHVLKSSVIAAAARATVQQPKP